FQAEVGIRDRNVTGVQTCALPIFIAALFPESAYSYFKRTILQHKHAIKQVASIIRGIFGRSTLIALRIGERISQPGINLPVSYQLLMVGKIGFQPIGLNITQIVCKKIVGIHLKVIVIGNLSAVGKYVIYEIG